MSGPVAPDPSELLARARAGDRRAFERLMDDVLPSLFDAAATRTGERDRALDVTAAALIRAWTELPGFRRDGNFRPWLDDLLRDEIAARTAPRLGATDLRQVRHVVTVAIASTRPASRWQLAVRRMLPRRPRPGPGAAHRGRRVAGVLAFGIGACGLVGAAAVASSGPSGSHSTAVSSPAPVASGPSALPPTPVPTRSAVPTAEPSAVAARGPDLVAWSLDGDIWIQPFGGGVSTLLAHLDGLQFSAPAWSPDGRRLLFVSDEPAVFIDDLADGRFWRIAAAEGASWSPDSGSIVVGDPLRIVDVTTGSSRRFEPPEGMQFVAGTEAWSPNGAWIAVVGVSATPDADGSRARALYRVSVKTGSSRLLLRLGCSDGAPAWSHDSRYVAIGDSTELGTCSSERPDDGFKISIVDTNGTQSTAIAAGAWGRASLNWAPDDRVIALALSAPDAWVVATIPAAPGPLTTIAVSTGPGIAWTSDGSALLYVQHGVGGSAGPGDVVAVKATGTGAPAVLSIRADSDLPALSVGRSVVGMPVVAAAPLRISGRVLSALTIAASVPPARPDRDWRGLAIPDPDSGCGAQSLSWDGSTFPTFVVPASGIDSCMGGVIGADGRRMLSVLNGQARILTDSGGVIPLAVGDPGFVTGASWSPRGDRVRLQMCDGESTCVAPRTVLISPDGAVLESVVGSASWSNDERHVAVARPDGTLEIGAADGTKLVAIGSFPEPSGWSPDGRRFLFVRGGQAWTAGLDGGAVSALTNFPYGGATDASWSPDGEWIRVRVGRSAEWLLDVRTSVSWLLPLAGETSDERWAPDGRGLAVTVASTPSPGLVVVRLGDSDPSAMTLRGAWAPAWSPDGRYLAFVEAPFNRDPVVDIANADGSGRRPVGATPSGGLLGWLPVPAP